MPVDFGTEDGHDLDQIRAELFHVRLIRGILQDHDPHTKERADLKDDFTPEAEQAVFVGHTDLRSSIGPLLG